MEGLGGTNRTGGTPGKGYRGSSGTYTALPPPQHQQVSGGSYAARSAQAYSAAAPHPTTQSPTIAQPPPFPVVRVPHVTNARPSQPPTSSPAFHESAAQAAEQSRLLAEATRRVQEAAYYMHRAMDADDLSLALDKATAMLGELGDPNHHHQGRSTEGNLTSTAPLSPKNYYELHMRTLDELPNLEEFLLALTSSSGVASPRYTMRHLYEAVQYCPRVVIRLYLQICAGSALIRSGELAASSSTTKEDTDNQKEHYAGAKVVLQDLIQGVKCVQCPIRGLFLRHYLLQAMKDKLPDSSSEADAIKTNVGTVIKEKVPPPASAPPPPIAVHTSVMASAMDDLLGGSTECGGVFGDTDDADLIDFGIDGEEQIEPTHQETDLLDELDSTAVTNTNDIATEKSNEEDKDDRGTVEDSYTFVLANFIEMNKLWVRIQHMPSSTNNNNLTDQKSKECRKKRERERNELRVLVGTNLVRLSQLEGVTSTIYGTIILPKILDQITACRDALAQAYLMDCIIQVFPDEFHIQTLEVLLSVCPRLREKVNVCTILQSIMERLANYYADEMLLNDEEDVDGVKMTVMLDSFQIFDDCIRSVFEARGPNMSPKEVIRLETTLLNFSLKCYPGRMDHINRCFGVCLSSLKGEDSSGTIAAVTAVSNIGERGSSTTDNDGISAKKVLDETVIDELEKLLSIPLEFLTLKVLDLEHYSDLLTFLPWDNRKQVAVVMLKAIIESSGTKLCNLNQIEKLFSIITPLTQNDPNHRSMAKTAARGADLLLGSLSMNDNLGMDNNVDSSDASNLQFREEQLLVAKLIHLLDHEDTDVTYEMLVVARNHLHGGGKQRVSYTLVPVVFSALKLLDRLHSLEFSTESRPANSSDAERAESTRVTESGSGPDEITGMVDDGDGTIELAGKTQAQQSKKPNMFDLTFSKSVNCRKVLVFLQKTVAMISATNPDLGFKLYLQIAASADRCAAAAQDRSGDNGQLFSSIARELLTQSFLLYEDEMRDSKIQQRAIVAMVGTLLSCRNFETKDYESLITKTTQYAAKLVKKTDQCKMVVLCSHLFFTTSDGNDARGAYRNPQRVLECLQRALKIADTCTMASPSNVQLFVDILDRYVYFFELKNAAISHKFVSGLVALINEHMESVNNPNNLTAEANIQFQQIVQYIKRKKGDAETADRFEPIIC